jgi:hypothetical protein
MRYYVFLIMSDRGSTGLTRYVFSVFVLHSVSSGARDGRMPEKMHSRRIGTRLQAKDLKVTAAWKTLPDDLDAAGASRVRTD